MGRFTDESHYITNAEALLRTTDAAALNINDTSQSAIVDSIKIGNMQFIGKIIRFDH